MRSRRCWSRSLTRHRLSTPSCIDTATFWPWPVLSRLTQRGENADRQVHAGVAVAERGGADGRRAVPQPVVEAAPPAHCATFS